MNVTVLFSTKCPMCSNTIDVQDSAAFEMSAKEITVRVGVPFGWWKFEAIGNEGMRRIQGYICSACLDALCGKPAGGGSDHG